MNKCATIKGHLLTNCNTDNGSLLQRAAIVPAQKKSLLKARLVLGLRLGESKGKDNVVSYSPPS